MPLEQLTELDTAVYTRTISYRNGAGTLLPLPGSQLQTCTLQVFEKSTGTVLRSRRDSLQKNDVSIAENGVLTWQVQSLDTRFVTDKTRHTIETHVAEFAVTWGSTKFGTLENAIKATGAGINQVIVEIPGHGLATLSTADYAFEEVVTLIISDFNAGGIILQGTFRVLIADGDLVYLETPCNATIDWNSLGHSEGLGLTTEYFIGGHRRSWSVAMKVVKGQEALCP